MNKSTRRHTRIFVLLSILTLSSASMLWALWHYPLSTGIATAGVLLGFGILVRLARAIDTDIRTIDTDIVDSVSGEQSA
jgi:hypothetical protein